MKKNVVFKEFARLSEACDYLLCKLSPLIEEAEKTEKAIVLTGGTSCQPLYKMLAERKKNWSAVRIFLSDERYVPVDDDESNYGMLKKLISNTVEMSPQVINYVDDPIKPIDEQVKYLNNRSFEKYFPTVFTFLGLGEDGHIASIFPEELSCDILQIEDYFLAARPDFQSTERISMSYKSLLSTGEVILLTSGKNRRKIIENAVKCTNPQLPIDYLVSRSDVQIEIVFVGD